MAIEIVDSHKMWFFHGFWYVCHNHNCLAHPLSKDMLSAHGHTSAHWAGHSFGCVVIGWAWEPGMTPGLCNDFPLWICDWMNDFEKLESVPKKKIGFFHRLLGCFFEDDPGVIQQLDALKQDRGASLLSSFLPALLGYPSIKQQQDLEKTHHS